MLQCKKIPSSIITKALAEIDYDTYLETLTALVLSKSKSIKSTNPSDKKAKIYRFATSVGVLKAKVSDKPSFSAELTSGS